MSQSNDDRSPMAIAMEWSSRVTTISLEMALPGVFGFWLDNRWGTTPLITVLGVVMGFAFGMMSLMRLAATAPPQRQQREKGQRREDSPKSDDEASPNQESD